MGTPLGTWFLNLLLISDPIRNHLLREPSLDSNFVWFHVFPFWRCRSYWFDATWRLCRFFVSIQRLAAHLWIRLYVFQSSRHMLIRGYNPLGCHWSNNGLISFALNLVLRSSLRRRNIDHLVAILYSHFRYIPAFVNFLRNDTAIICEGCARKVTRCCSLSQILRILPIKHSLLEQGWWVFLVSCLWADVAIWKLSCDSRWTRASLTYFEVFWFNVILDSSYNLRRLLLFCICWFHLCQSWWWWLR